MLCSVLLLLCSSLCVVTCYPQFRSQIPNGLFVPHPCRPSAIWRGVGHKNVLGGGARNPFGVDFNDNGRVWDATLCMKDSDGDGKTNGEELGDPDCMWTVGEKHIGSVTLSHPGVCEPVNSTLCLELNDWEIDCTDPEFSCDAVEKEEVFSETYRLSPTSVPAKDTTYMCMAFALPSDRDYHVIATKPYTDNINVMHHLLVYGLKNDTDSAALSAYSSPLECHMGSSQTPILFAWSIGLSGYCYQDTNGVRIGASTYTHILFEMHWTNPFETEGYVDSSGITLFFTPILREFDSGLMLVVPHVLQLPPGQHSAGVEGYCSGICTEQIFPDGAKIDYAYPHMHYLGRGFHAELRRNGEVVSVIFDLTNYNYDSAALKLFDPPLEIQPGDVITLSCSYDTINQEKIVFYGDSSFNEEMCILFFNYYPKQTEIGDCFGQGEEGISWCGGEYLQLRGAENHLTCLEQIAALFFGPPDQWSEWTNILSKSCDPNGIACLPGCGAAIAKVKSHICFQGDFEIIMKSLIILTRVIPDTFLFMLESCTYTVRALRGSRF